MKKLSIALMALGLSGLGASAAIAGHPGEVMMPAAPTVNVTIPQQQGSWEIGLEALYWQQANGDFHYGVSTSTTTTAGPPITITQNVLKTFATDPEHSWGIRFDVAYLFPGNGRDVQLVYTHIHDDESDTTLRVPGVSLNGFGNVVNTGDMTTFPNGWDRIRGKIDNDYDAIDLVFGQKMDFGQKVTLRAFGGLRYADIDFKDRALLRADGLSGVDPVVALGELNLHSDVEGLGPRAGMDATVRLGSNFAINGTFAGSLLVANRDHHLDSSVTVINQTTLMGTTALNTQKLSEKTAVVPELDARLGLGYTHAFSPDTALGVELGYHVVNYFNAKDNSLTSYADTMSHNNDFALHGPYLRFQLDIA